MAGAILVLAGLVGLVLVAVPAEAVMNRPFAIRYQANDKGDILLRGNSLVTCPTATTNCPEARNGTATGNALNNNAYNMEFVNTDTDPATASSSTARLTLPATASVKFAGLYWSAYTNGASRTAPPATTDKTKLQFMAPGDTSYRTVTAAPSTPTNPVDSTADGAPYVSFADVTSIVQGAGSGDYTGANIYAATGPDSYAAWSLVVVIRDTTLPRRDLIVFDGFGTIQSNPSTDNTLDIPLTGLSTPDTGPVNMRLGAVVFEGDAGLTGDQFQIINQANVTTPLSNTLNPATNVFNSTNTDNDVDVPDRNPPGNLFGFDADVFNSSVALGNSATTATLRMTTTQERFFPAVATFVSDSYAPLLDLTRSATVNDTVADGRTRTGDRITYTIDVTNNGNASSVNTKITDSIPAGTTYVPGSLTVDGNPVSDAANTDAGEVSAGTVSVRLGSGAGGSGGSGGSLTTAPAAGSTTRITYTVEITDPYTAGGAVSGGATQATYADNASRTFAATSNTSPATPVAQARADLAVTQATSPAVIQRGTPTSVTWTATVTNNGPDTETAPQLVETLPAGVTGVSVVGATCTNSGTTYTCSVVSLASGASKSVAFTATVPATGADPTLAGAVVSGAGTDPTSGNNTDSTGVGVNSAPTPTADFAPLNSPDFSTDINVLANDTDPDTGDTLTLSSVTAPTHGTATIVGGKVRYTLTDQTFIGSDTFTYTACDNRGGCSTPTTVSVAVNDHRRADLKVTQTASPQVVQQAGNRTVTWTAVLTNQGPQAEPSPVLVQKLPADVSAVTYTGATCTVSGITLTCAPGALATGASATVKFTATLPSTAPDPSSATATLSGSLPDPDPSNNTAVAVVGVNRPPLVKADTATLAADVLSLDLPVAANDSDPDSDPLTVTAVTKPAHGTATIVDGKIRYTLTDSTFSGDETLTYTVCDNRGGCTDATVTLAVADHELADLVVTQTADPKLVQRDGSRVATWTVSVNNAGPERARKPVLVQTLPAGVTAISSSLAACTVTGVVVTCPLDTLANGDTDTITFTATLPADGSDPATASASVTSGSPDPKSSNNTGTVSVALNTAPVADDDAVSLPSTAVKVTIPALFGDQDTDGDPLVLHSVEKPKHGTATIVKGKIVYELTDLTFSGDETFSYEVCDDRSGCDTAQITVHVADHQHAPVAVADKVSVVAGNPVKIDVGANDHDADGGTLTVSKITKAPKNGTATLVKGKILYTPDDGFVGTDTVTYEVCDSTDLCTQATATVQVTAAPPVVKPDTAKVRPGGTTVIDVLGNDTDPAGYPLGSLKILGQPASGTATVKGNTIHYTAPKSAKAGIVTIRYQVCNKTGACSEGVVALTIAGDPVKNSGTGSALAYTGSRVLPPLVLTAVVLLLGGLMTRGLLSRGRSPRGRHKA